MEPQATNAAAPTSDWPGAFGMFKKSAAAVKRNVWIVLGLDVVLLILSGITNGNKEHPNPTLVLIGMLVSILFQVALVSVYLAGARDQEQSFGDAVKIGAKHYVNAFMATILTAFLLVLSFLALVVPFFFVLPRLQLVLYYVVDKNMGPMEAIKASWNNSKGHSLKIWGLIGVSILFAFLCIIIVGIYLLFMYQAVFALAYLYVQSKQSSASPAANTPVNDAPVAS